MMWRDQVTTSTFNETSLCQAPLLPAAWFNNARITLLCIQKHLQFLAACKIASVINSCSVIRILLLFTISNLPQDHQYCNEAKEKNLDIVTLQTRDEKSSYILGRRNDASDLTRRYNEEILSSWWCTYVKEDFFFDDGLVAFFDDSPSLPGL